MANTAPVYARIEKSLKENAEGILAQLGISPSEAIKMLYSQIVLVKGMPFQLKLPDANHFSASGIAKAEFDAELQKGVDSINSGRTHSAEDVDRMLAEEF
ncbi:MAG: type II toxin-antitoxin system RelB/DinJ family antitoxin [Lachnospiraceae bacterium]|nr:type II toxin-antitoxin system RelB/DinJ family antitoxin [Lachnospiraceae bacterium]